MGIKVMATGTFDILHYGHVEMLRKAKELGDYLRVGLNEKKNGKETYYSYEDRKKMLEAIRYVDEVVKIGVQEDKFKYLGDIDIFACGEEYRGYKDIGDIEKYCRVVYISRTPNVSSTEVKKYLSSGDDPYKTIIVDVDETLCYVHNRDFANGIPNREVIDRVNEYYDNGYKVIISTARGQKSCKTVEEMNKKYREVTERWLMDNGVKYHELEIGYKKNADLYVDDKAIRPDEFVLRRVKKL